MSTIGVHPELEVKNFGPIWRANIKLRPLSVFIGPSNTGKSYLAILIYALHRYFGNYVPGFLSAAHDSIPQDTLRELRKLRNEMGGIYAFHETDSPKNQDEIILQEPIAAILRTMFLRMSGTRLKDEIARCFGLEVKLLRRRDANDDSHIILRAMPADGGEAHEHHLTLGLNETTFQTVIPDGIELKLQRNFFNAMSRRRWRRLPLPQETGLSEDALEYFRARADVISLLADIAEYLASDIYEPFAQPAYYLPAARTGIMHAHKTAVNAALDNAVMAGIRQVPNAPLLSGIIADFLEKLITVDNPLFRRQNTGQRKDILKICEEIEKDILGGSIRIESSEITNYTQFSYRPSGWPETLPLKNASSMVSELAPVLLYLRYQVNPDDVLIIEEPEAHLHPSMQVQFTRQLAAMVNAGIRIIVTTHSEWVLEELANLVNLSSLPTSDRFKIDGGGVALPADDVGAWLFRRGTLPSGSIVSPIDLDESGLYPTGFDDVATALHNNWARISRQLDN